MSKLGSFYLIEPQSWFFQEKGRVAQAKQRAEQYQQKYGSLQGAERQIEEFVRQWVIDRLIKAYGYPAEWVGQQLVIEKRLKIFSYTGQVDIALTNRFGDAFIYIETKAFDKTNNAVDNGKDQLKSYLSCSYSTPIGCFTDSISTHYFEKAPPNKFKEIEDLPTAAEAIERGFISAEDLEFHRADEKIETEDVGIHQKDEVNNEEAEEYELEETDVPPFPPASAYKRAFQAIAPQLTAKQREILRVHYYAEDQTITMSEIAEAIGYKSFRPANAQYGRIGRLLCDTLGWYYGYYINVLVASIPPDLTPNHQWHLIMLDEVAQALEELGWV